MQISSIIIGIAGGIIGAITSASFLITAEVQTRPLILLILFLSIIGIIAPILDNIRPAMKSMLMLAAGAAFIGARWLLPPVIFAAPFFIISGILFLMAKKAYLETGDRKNYFLKIFISAIAILTFSKILSLAVSYIFIGENLALFLHLNIIIYAVAVAAYSALYALSFKIYKFSLKYSIIYNFLLGISLVINTVLIYKTKIGWTYHLFSLFIILQIFIASALRYKKSLKKLLS